MRMVTRSIHMSISNPTLPHYARVGQWAGLERIRGLSAVPAVWRRHLGEEFEGFKRAFLLPRAEAAKSFPCERCGCAHEIHEGRVLGVEGRGESDVIAVCSCEPWNCADLV